jgi:LytS/YehU family sensor histidine kinase
MLPHPTSYVRILFGTTDLRSSLAHEFRYRTQAAGGWIRSDRPEIILLNPSAGSYAVEVSYRKTDGNWSEPLMLCRFRIAPPFYATWYFIVFVSLTVIFVAFWIFRIVLKRVKQRHAYQTTINQLEQKALRAQMNPHFIFNSLNSIQSFLVYEENDRAERYLLKFAQLIRQTLNNSRESYIPIETEMQTLQHYLELEQMRFKNKFDFEIVSRLSEEELRYGVPPMLIQPFVENAVLHGFQSVQSGGNISVVFESLENNRLLCTVEDNGVGRKATMKTGNGDHKSFGTKITAERLEAFREKYGDRFTIRTIDKETDGKPSGTLIILQIPVAAPGDFSLSDEP